jgi:hypothetical protein
MTPVTEPGWYKLGPKGLERICGLEELPDDIADVPPLTELVRVEVDPAAAVEEPLW